MKATAAASIPLSRTASTEIPLNDTKAGASGSTLELEDGSNIDTATGQPCLVHIQSSASSDTADENISYNNNAQLLTPQQEESHNTRRSNRNNIFDKLEMAFCIAFFVICLVCSEVIFKEPHERPIPYQYLDNSGDYVRSLVFNQEKGTETVSDLMLVIFSGIVPLMLQLFITRFFGRAGDAHATICIYFTALGLTVLITGIIKVYAGYLRPYFYTACEPDDNYQTCTNEDINDARKSFPSGHSSISFCAMTILSNYLQRTFGIASIMVLNSYPMPNGTYRLCLEYEKNLNRNNATNRKHPAIYRLISLLSLSPYIVAIFFAASRVVDNAHHPADVVGGAVLGAAIAMFFYRLWFPYAPYLMPKTN